MTPEQKLISGCKKLLGDFTTTSRKRQYVLARIAVAKCLRKTGYTFKGIGDILGLHHTTVIFMLESERSFQIQRAINNNIKLIAPLFGQMEDVCRACGQTIK